jgi:cation transport ATPase
VEPEKKPARKKTTKDAKPIDGALGNQKITTKTSSVSAPVEAKEEMLSRLRREEKRHEHEIFKEKALLVATLGVTGFMMTTCLGILAFSSSLALQSWATGALTTTLGAYVGWFAAKQAK